MSLISIVVSWSKANLGSTMLASSSVKRAWVVWEGELQSDADRDCATKLRSASVE